MTEPLFKNPFASGLINIPAWTDHMVASAPPDGVHLYHFPISLCSQKARWALEEAGQTWTSHLVLLPLSQQYEPAYLQLNPRGVVPTLVNNGKVTTDSLNIMRYINQTFHPAQGLLPQDHQERDVTEQFLELADGLPMGTFTYGSYPSPDPRPAFLRRATKGQYNKRHKQLTALIKQNQHDFTLTSIYESKLQALDEQKDRVETPEEISQMLAQLAPILDHLEQQLANGPAVTGGWLTSSSFSLADIAWGTVLHRFGFLGLAPRLWGQRPAIQHYITRINQRKSFQKAVLKWHRILPNLFFPMLLGTLGLHSYK
jgi:glutathione S-transferase